MNLRSRLDRLEQRQGTDTPGAGFWDVLCGLAEPEDLDPVGQAMLQDFLSATPDGDIPDPIEELLKGFYHL